MNPLWRNVSLRVAAAQVDALSDALLAQGALSVGVEDALAGTPEETPQFDEPGSADRPVWAESRLVALFPASDDLVGRVAQAAQAAGLEDLPELELEDVAEQNWVQLTQAQFEPIRINAGLWIVPSWHTAPDPTAVNLVLDPGLAFGTGSHPTTRLCLEWLCTVASSGQRVLDYGCGSGILAIAAAKLGASQALGVDIDASALEAARENAARNAAPIELRHSRDALGECFDLVVANILTNPLCVLAPLLAERVAPGGRIALSGILETQAEQVIAAYAPYLRLSVGATAEGWVRLEGQRTERQAKGRPEPDAAISCECSEPPSPPCAARGMGGMPP